MKNFLILSALTLSLSAAAQSNPLWMRYSSISPDGQTIVFSYKGDVFSVASSGGNAHQLTSNAAYDAYPIWSPDGSHIAFASSREGSLDVYVMDKNGGEPKRLTTSSNDETPIAWRDNDHILFGSDGMQTAKSIYFPGSQFPQVYEVDLQADRPKLFSAVNMEDLSINQNGDILYQDKKGYEDLFRKHHQSPITRDIWINRKGSFTKLTTFNGEDRTPRWAPDGASFYYLSEESGSFNVYQRNLEGTEKTQLTSYTKHPVRYLSVAANGTICYAYDGEIYIKKDGQEPQKVNISIAADRNDIDLERQIKSRGATEIALSPNGKEIGFVLHGDVYVTNIEYKTTKQITDTPEQERSIDFSPDGLAIVYDSERGGLWQIYQTKMKNKDEKQFAYSTDLVEEQIVKSPYTSFQPKYSPDGKSIAFLESRGTIKAIDVKSKQVRTLMDGKYVYSYSDGDIWFEWSPDSKWLISNYIGTGGWQNQDIALINADGNQEIHDLTLSGYNDGNGKWVLGGKAMLFTSDRAGYRSHGSWGSEDDVYIMFFDLDAYEKFKMTKEEKSLIDEAEKTKKEAAEPKNVDVTVKKQEKKEEPIKLDLDNCRDRVIRLTSNSSRLGDAVLSDDGNALYYQAAFEDGYDLWKHDLQDNSTKIIMKGVGHGNMLADKDFKNLYLCADNAIKKIDISSSSFKNIEFEARFNYKPYKERQYMFDHVWQQVKDKFYNKDLHGVDWDGYRKAYERFLPYINNNYDFRDMLSEMLGELNASHTGARYYGNGAKLKTATLGLFFDDTYEGNGLKVEEVIKRGPFAVKNTGVTKGCILEKIDGDSILQHQDYNAMLDGKAGKPVHISVYDPSAKKHFDVTIKPISKGEQNDILYKRWVDRNRALVDSLSHGRLAYVHVKAMDSESFRTVFEELLNNKNRNKDAVIVDERHNGGGWLHDDLCTLLSGKQYQSFVPRGQNIGKDPWNKWTKPSCVMICEDDYSNGHGFPFVYKTLGIGKLIGTPIAGTMTAVWWETMIDPTMVFGIPQVGCMDMQGHYGENNQLDPDVKVYNTPEDYLNGNDQQLKRAVEEMLKK